MLKIRKPKEFHLTDHQTYVYKNSSHSYYIIKTDQLDTEVMRANSKTGRMDRFTFSTSYVLTNIKDKSWVLSK